MKRRITESGIEIQPRYESSDVADLDLAHQPGPGEYPYLRGIQKDMYRGRLWTMRQYAGFGSAKESNARYRYLRAQGQSGLSVAFDLPTQMGMDSDAPQAAGEVGRTGVAIDTVEDMDTLFDGIPQDRVSVSMTINAPASILLALLPRRRTAARRAVRQTFGHVAKRHPQRVRRARHVHLSAGAVHAFGHRSHALLRRTRARLEHDQRQRLPHPRGRRHGGARTGLHARKRTRVSSGGRRRRSGYRRRRAPRLIFWNAHNNFFEEIAKFRASRTLWADIVRHEFEAKSPKSWLMRFHTQTGGSTLTAQEPDNNVVRVTLQALAAVMGGTQSLHTNGKDEALALPTERSAKLALRTQQIIANESGVADTADPLGGSYFVERLTSDIAGAARAIMAEIDTRGGAVAAIEAGWIQEQIADSAYRAQARVESGEAVIVGVNKYVDPAAQAQAVEVHRIDPALEREQRESLAAFRARRDGELVAQRLAAVKRAAAGSAPLLPEFVEAVDAGCTLGETCDALREIFSVHRPTAFV